MVKKIKKKGVRKLSVKKMMKPKTGAQVKGTLRRWKAHGSRRRNRGVLTTTTTTTTTTTSTTTSIAS